MYKKLLKLFLVVVFFCDLSFSQGPPITGDKVIMLGENRIVLRNLTEYRLAENTSLLRTLSMIHYIPHRNFLLAGHIPIIASFSKENRDTNQLTPKQETFLGDLEFLMKYQFYRYDEIGGTIRWVVKFLQIFPTGREIVDSDLNLSLWQTYIALIRGHETLRYGLSNEVGYLFRWASDEDELILKLSFGLPLLQPTYPVKQINLYFEAEQKLSVEKKGYVLFYAQGIQYANFRWTIETAVSFSVIEYEKKYSRRKSLFLGARYIF